MFINDKSVALDLGYEYRDVYEIFATVSLKDTCNDNCVLYTSSYLSFYNTRRRCKLSPFYVYTDTSNQVYILY